jgi:hypothetical protein
MVALSGELARQWSPPAPALHAEIKRIFDPTGLLNPGKKVATPRAPAPVGEEKRRLM